MAYSRSGLFDNVDPYLLAWIDQAAKEYTGPYDIALHSGYRAGPRQHGRGKAVDFRLVDPKTQRELNDYQDPNSFAAYQAFANLVRKAQMAANPEAADTLRWGGYFGGPKGKYGAMDLMHLDTGGGPGLGMAGGGWDKGLTPEQAALWGLSPGVGGYATPDQLPLTDDAYRKAALSAIRQMESSNRYNVITGGRTFTDMSRHPDARVPIGPATEGNYSTAAGGYQFVSPTWQKYATKLGLKDFSEKSQDAAAWALMVDTLAGGDEKKAYEMLRGDPAAVSAALGSQWEALKKDPKKFADLYKSGLGSGAATTAAGTAVPAVGGATVPPAAAAVAAKDGKGSLAEDMQKAIAGMGGGGDLASVGMGDAPALGGGNDLFKMPAQVQPMIAADEAAAQRQQLAMMRLNNKTLWG